MSESGAVPSVMRDAADSWRQAEDRLFPLAMTDTERYERSVALVGLLRPHFEERASVIDDLIAAHAVAEPVARAVAAREGISTSGIDLELVVGSAAAARLRALLGQSASGQEDRALQDAQAAGLTWAVVEEPRAAAAGYGVPMTWVEVHVASRARLVRTISMDDETGSARFAIEVHPPGQSQPMLRLELDSRAEWVEESQALRQTFDQVGASEESG